MGQKVNPIAFRLDVPHRGNDCLMFRQPLVESNRSGTRDRLGWTTTFSGAMDKWTYGAMRAYVQSRVDYTTETRRTYGRVVNRHHVHVANGAVERHVEWRPRDLDAYDGLTSGSPRRSASVRQEDLPEALARVEGRFESMGVTLPRGSEIRRVTIHSVNLRDRARSHPQWGIDFDKVKAKARLKGKDDHQRVKVKSLVAAMRRAGMVPVAPRMARRVAMALEDTVNPTKHSDVLGDVRAMRLKSSESSEFGLLGHHEVGLDEHGRRLPPKVHGGYRGCRVLVKGTIDASRRTRKDVIQRGIIPLSTRSAPMSSWIEASNTKSGSRGVHVVYFY